MNIGDRPIGAIDDRQRRGIGLDEQQRRLGIVSFVADRLSQCGRGQKGRDQHHILDLVGGQRIAQRGGIDGIRPGDSRRRQLVAARGCALPGPQDRRDHLVGWANCRILLRGNVEIVFIDGGASTIFTFDQHHPDRRRRHRHTKYGVQSSLHGRLLAGHARDVVNPHVFPLPPEFTRVLALGIGCDRGPPEPICPLLRDGYRCPKPPWPPPKPPNPWPPPNPPNPWPPPNPPKGPPPKGPRPPPKGPPPNGPRPCPPPKRPPSEGPPPNDPGPCSPPKRPPSEGPPGPTPSLGSGPRIPGGTSGTRGTGTSAGGGTTGIGTGAAGSGPTAGGIKRWGAATGVGNSSLGFGTDA